MFSVIFDMDGTLLDTQQICVPAWEYAGKNQGIDGVGKHIYKICGMNEHGWTAYLENNFPSINVAKFKSEMREYIIKNGKVTLKKGARELVAFLKEHNIKIALASGSSRESINHHLNEVGADSWFDGIVGSHDVVNGKPAPDVFLLAAEKIGAKPSDCFVIEDSPNGIRAGYAAGMRCIGVPDLADFSDEVKKLIFKQVESLDEIIDILKHLCELEK